MFECSKIWLFFKVFFTCRHVEQSQVLSIGPKSVRNCFDFKDIEPGCSSKRALPNLAVLWNVRLFLGILWAIKRSKQIISWVREFSKTTYYTCFKFQFRSLVVVNIVRSLKELELWLIELRKSIFHLIKKHCTIDVTWHVMTFEAKID